MQVTPEPNLWWMAEGRQYIRFFDHESGRHDNIYFMCKSRVPATAALRINATSNISQRIAEKANEQKTRMLLRDFIPSRYYDQFSSIFDKDGFDELPPKCSWDHAIDIVPGAPPMKVFKVYPISPSEQKELDDFLEENQQSGHIRKSKSPWDSSFFFVKKKDGKLRPVQDYRKLNSVTVKNAYPLLLISNVIGKLRGAHWFSKMDVRWGFNNIRIREGDEHKAAFLTNHGLFEPTVMFFGLCNSPSTFQMMMNNLLHDLIVHGVVMVYMDDILVYTSTLDEHQKVVMEVLEILEKNKLFLKPEKCESEKESIEYLSIVVGNGTVSMDPHKVSTVQDWPRPLLGQPLNYLLKA